MNIHSQKSNSASSAIVEFCLLELKVQMNFDAHTKKPYSANVLGQPLYLFLDEAPFGKQLFVMSPAAVSHAS